MFRLHTYHFNKDIAYSLHVEFSMQRIVRLRAPASKAWFNLGEFATTEADLAAYRDARAVDTKLTGISSKYASPPPEIDWKSWEDKIAHKEILGSLKAFHSKQMSALSALGSEDHHSSVSSLSSGWSELFDPAVSSCEKSVEASEEILRNGARALYISCNNPSSSNVTQSEWLDTDQYWQAFTEKHMHFGNYLNTSEDPEAKETIAAQEAAILKQFNTFDGRGVARFNNKLLYQRPSHEYYDVYRGIFVEHMIFYLLKTGGDARFFPELPPTAWLGEMYENRFEMYDVLQRRRRAFQDKELLMDLPLEMTPHDLEEEGAKYYADWIKREGALTEMLVARLMGNYIFLSDAVPVQSESALLRIERSGEIGAFYSLGEDVSALFWVKGGDKKKIHTDEVDPQEAIESLFKHLRLTGRVFSPGYAQLLTIFHRILSSRKNGCLNRWFRAPQETNAQAFMRRLKPDDPSRNVYEAYVSELSSRWETAVKIDSDKVFNLIKEKEKRYNLESAEWEGVVASFLEKTETFENLEKFAFNDSGESLTAEKLAEIIPEKDKIIEIVMNTRIPSLDSKKK